jgi:hypothetical protein
MGFPRSCANSQVGASNYEGGVAVVPLVSESNYPSHVPKTRHQVFTLSDIAHQYFICQHISLGH